MDNIQILEMNSNDIDDVLELEKSHNVSILTTNMLLKDLNESNNYYLIAKFKNKIVGYIGINYILDTADIISIVVDKNFTRRGIASSLLNEIYRFCIENKISKLFLEVRKSNKTAQNLYLKHNFTKISERKKYYNGIEDAYIMQKEIPII